jgi:alpha-beta hydrolase superfamily lysophospholipase
MASIDWKVPPGKPESIVLLAHGLNLRPERMEALAALHRAHGAVTGIFVLPGHEPGSPPPGRRSAGRNPNPLVRGDAGAFLRAAEGALEELRRAKGRFAVSRSRFVGVSLGALAVLDALVRHPVQAFDDAILLAPALALRRRAMLLEFPARWLPGWIPVPSFSRPRDRIYPFLPLGAYRLLYRLLADFRRGLADRAADTRPLSLPMRIYLDPKDELIRPAGLRRLIRDGLLPGARLVMAPESTFRPAHLMVDRASLGEELWDDLVAYVEGSSRSST